MEPIYTAAVSIVGRTQPSLDGGLFTFALNNLIRLPDVNRQSTNATSTHSPSDHVLLTMARTGYALSLAFGLIWVILLAIATVFMCTRRRRRKRQSTRMVYMAGTGDSGDEDAAAALKPSNQSSYSRLFRRKRDRLQSHWICQAAQFVLLIVLVVLLGTGVILGFTASSQLHANLASAPTHEEAVGRLLTPAELERINPPRTYVFPRILRALAQIRAYLTGFVHYTKLHTSPIVSELITATEQMQDRLANNFNALLFERLGVAKAFELGDNLGSNVISLIQHSMAIVKLGEDFVTHFDRFKIELHNWLRIVNSFGPSVDDTSCSMSCQLLRATFVSNLTARPDTFMPSFNFAIALKFVTTDQNQTAESVQDQLNQGRLLAAKQLNETKQIMAERLQIPKNIRDTINRQFESLEDKMGATLQIIDQLTPKITRSIAPRVSSASTIALTFGTCFWVILLLLVLGATWLVLHHYCVPSEIQSRGRRRVHRAAGCGLFLLTISMLLATGFFFVSGYLYTEACRYMDPMQTRITVVEHDTVQGSHGTKLVLPLDSHINEFINHNWAAIIALANKSNPPGTRPMPIPHIRSPVYGLMHNCRDDVGILQALDAIHDFNMSSLNDPEMSEDMVRVGREIMMQSLQSLDIQEMFPKETDEQLSMAGRLDDFIVNFEDIRRRLPVAYVSVRKIEEDDSAGHYTPYPEQAMWEAWDAYYKEVLESRLTGDQRIKLTIVTEQVRGRFFQLSSVVQSIDEHLSELSKAKRVSPVVLELQNSLVQLKRIMADKSALLQIADQLFDEHIASKTPDEAAKLIVQFGPAIMAQVGRCRRLYEASMDFHGAACSGVVSVINGIWFVTGWVTLVGTLLITFGLLLLVNKTSTLPKPGKTQGLTLAANHSPSSRQSPAPRSKVYTAAPTMDSCIPAELEQLTEEEMPQFGPLQLRDIDAA